MRLVKGWRDERSSGLSDLGRGGWSAPVETINLLLEIVDLRSQRREGGVDFLDHT
jgi:hypothetical protein